MSKTERRGSAKELQDPHNEVKAEKLYKIVGDVEETTEEAPRTQQELEGRTGLATEISGFDTLRDITRGLV